jgi:prophage regulatory protein
MGAENSQELWRLSKVKQKCGLSRSAIYLAVSLGKFPKQVSIGERAVAWVSAEVEEWVEQKIAQRGG